MISLAQTFDVALLDLDGTVYLGGTVIDHVPAALTAAAAQGMASVFVTNNASRPPAVVAQALSDMGIQASEGDVLTSPQVAADLLAQAHPACAKVLVVGAEYLHQAVAEAGLDPVSLATDDPVAVVQGHSPDTGWRELAEACIALRAGADWVACNTDSTLPTDRGLLPGNGAMVAALVAATGRRPRVAGKPARPLLDAAIARTGAARPLVVGDRLDTDIEAAVGAGLPALMPLTGVNTASDLLTAPRRRRPTHVCFDLRGLTDPTRVVEVGQPSADAGAWRVTRDSDRLLLTGPGTRDEHQDGSALHALAALLAAAWGTPGEHAATDALDAAGHEVDAELTVSAGDQSAAEALRRLGIEASDPS